MGRVTIIQNKFRQITSLLPYFVTYQGSSMEHKSTPFKHLSFNYNSFVWFFPAHCVCVQFEFSTSYVMADFMFILSVCVRTSPSHYRQANHPLIIQPHFSIKSECGRIMYLQIVLYDVWLFHLRSTLSFFKRIKLKERFKIYSNECYYSLATWQFLSTTFPT